MRYDMPAAYGDDALGGSSKLDGVNRVMKVLLESGATLLEMQSQLTRLGKAKTAARSHLMFLHKNGVELLVNGQPYRKGQRLQSMDSISIALEVEATHSLRYPEGGHCPEEVSINESHHEGSVVQITINAYERDSTARRKCLAHHGYRCTVCSKSMEEVYGPTGSGLIHVHHRRPLHTIGKDYKVDPINDLVPVCPNCHAVLHRPDKCLAVDELIEILKSFQPSSI